MYMKLWNYEYLEPLTRAEQAKVRKQLLAEGATDINFAGAKKLRFTLDSNKDAHKVFYKSGASHFGIKK